MFVPFLQGSNGFETPETQLGDFFSQLPTGLFVTVCGAGLLLMFAFAWFVYFKPLYKTRKQQQMTVSNEEFEMPIMKRKRKETDDDMPDLDMLLDASSLSKELPTVGDVPEPAIAHKPAPVRYQRGDVRVKMKNGATIPAEEVLSVLRDPRDGRLIVQINNTGYRSLTESPNIKEEFVKIMRELSDVVTKPDDNPPDPSEFIAESKPTKVKSSAPPPPVSLDGAMPGDLPKYRLEDSVKPTTRGKYEATPVPEFNIANSIEAYLQHKLKHTPEYDGVILHVLPAPGGGVRIQVDDVFYEAVSDVDDPNIREFLQETIQEWQTRQ